MISSDAWLNSKTPTARAAMARTRLAPALPTQSQSDLRVFCARPKQTPQERQSDLKFLALKCGGCWRFTPRRGTYLARRCRHERQSVVDFNVSRHVAGCISPDGVAMNDRLNPQIGRRDLLRVLTVGAAAAPVAVAAAAPQPANTAKPGKARYQANSPEVQTFYRVNRYPAK